MRIILITQARINSTRLPGKVLLPVMGRPLLYFHLERLKMVQGVNQIVVATVDNPTCAPIEALARSCGVETYRGSESDVLDRYYQAAKIARADAIIRVTSDCPLIDPHLIDRLIEIWNGHKQQGYISININEFARGFDAELFPFTYLEKSWKDATHQADREHVTRFMYTHPEQFEIRQLHNDREHIGQYRFCVDTTEDLELATLLLETLWPQNPSFTWSQIIDTMKKNPDWFHINTQVEQNPI